jgi:hypothetical protein
MELLKRTAAYFARASYGLISSDPTLRLLTETRVTPS